MTAGRYFICSIIALFVGVMFYVEQPESSGCVDTRLKEVPSPDGKTIAVLDESLCDVGSFSRIFTAGVSLHPANDPSDITLLLGVDSGGEPDMRPVVTWSSPTRLSVTVPNLSRPKILQTRVGSIEMQLHFHPDDPKARAAWMDYIDRSLAGKATLEDSPLRDAPPTPPTRGKPRF